jgi:peptide-methionine (S)-S-oxide reductase
MKTTKNKQSGKNETIVLGCGCFWCTEAIYKRIIGIISVMPGYAGGITKNPTYEEVCAGNTGHAEVIQIRYDVNKIDLTVILDIFFASHDPTTYNRQGNDVGSEYRSIILYTTQEQKSIAEACIQSVQKNYGKPIVTEVEKLNDFYPAEDNHKDYFAKNPLQPYCMLVILPKLAKVKKKFKDRLK